MSNIGNTCKLPLLKNGIAQVAIIVEDLDKAVENYWKLFGIGNWHFYTYGKPLVKRMTYHGKPSEYKMRVALSYLGPMRIELIEMLEGDTIYGKNTAFKTLPSRAIIAPCLNSERGNRCVTSLSAGILPEAMRPKAMR